MKRDIRKIKKKGTNAENHVRLILESKGFIARRSPSSLTAIDLEAVKGETRLGIQVKSGKGRISKKELADLETLARLMGVTPLIACKEDGTDKGRWIFKHLDGSRFEP